MFIQSYPILSYYINLSISRKRQKLMSRYKIEREYIFSSKPYQQISEFLKQYPNINLEYVKDQKRNTALHQAAYNSSDLRILKKYLDHMQKYYAHFQKQDPSGMFKHFVNLGNQDGMTALHFAAYKGNFKALDMLCNYGADYGKTTASGHNVLHLAAQSGTVETFIFFQSLVDINSRDNKQSTPLHWACYMNNQSIVTFLLAQPNIDVNAKDQKNQTPLHLATTYGHTKLVKKLLRAGGDTTLQNSSGQTALKIARDNQFKNIQKILNNQNSALDHCKLYFNLKNTYRPESRSLQKPILYISSMLVTIALRILFLQYSSTFNFLSYVEYAFYSILIIFYLTLVKPPSRQRPQKYMDFLNANTNMKRVCLACALVKPRRSFHCQVCKICISRYDHHCYWINNCIGKHNLGRFISFIFLFQILLFFFIWVSISSLTQFYTQTQYPLHFKQGLQYFGMVYIFSIGIFSFGFSFPMMALIVVHVKNLLLNKTTYERFTKDKISTLTESTSHLLQDELKSKRSKGLSLSNAIAMCKDTEPNEEQSYRDSIDGESQY